MLKNQTIFFVAMVAILFVACKPKTKTTEVAETEKPCCTAEVKPCCANKANDVDITQVVYFHNERRCATCMAVEEVSKELITLLDSASIAFHSYEIGTEEAAKLVKKLEISGQTLLVIGKDTTIDLTNSAFMNARVNPDQYKEELKNALESL